MGDTMTLEPRDEASEAGAAFPTAWAGVLVETLAASVTLGRTQVLTGVDLTVEPGRWLTLIGPGGAGTSTLLRVLAGDCRYDGHVLLDGIEVAALSARERSALLGHAPQRPTLPEGIRVREYVTTGRAGQHGLRGGPREADRAAVEDLLERLDLVDVADRHLRALGSGERQRAVLARALAPRPRLLLLDEPTAGLDVGSAQRVLDVVAEVRRDDGVTVVSTMQDLALAAQYADRLALLDDGEIVLAGEPADVLTKDVVTRHFGARVEVSVTPEGVRVHPVRRS